MYSMFVIENGKSILQFAYLFENGKIPKAMQLLGFPLLKLCDIEMVEVTLSE